MAPGGTSEEAEESAKRQPLHGNEGQATEDACRSWFAGSAKESAKRQPLHDNEGRMAPGGTFAGAEESAEERQETPKKSTSGPNPCL